MSNYNRKENKKETTPEEKLSKLEKCKNKTEKTYDEITAQIKSAEKKNDNKKLSLKSAAKIEKKRDNQKKIKITLEEIKRDIAKVKREICLNRGHRYYIESCEKTSAGLLEKSRCERCGKKDMRLITYESEDINRLKLRPELKRAE